ncbi:MAG: carbon-nitrogen hydrolase family protein [Nocardioides sp.]
MTWTTLTVALVQEAAGLDPVANRARLGELTPDGADLVVFPEVFQRDFGTPGEPLEPYAEPIEGGGADFARQVGEVADEHGTTIVAGMLERSPESSLQPYNTLIMRGSTSGEYRKIHLYDSFGYRESEVLAPGETKPAVVEVIDQDGNPVPIGLMTCYDLRFPELARALVEDGAEVLVVPAAWVAGERKVDHWRTLLRARAIENTVYVVACGQPAPRYCGHSMVVDPMGDVIAEAGPDSALITATLTRSELVTARRVNPSLANRRM